MNNGGRYSPLAGGGGGSKRSSWPLCELKAFYNCQLCGSNHIVVVRSKGVLMDAALAHSFMNTVKRDLVVKFFSQHPKASIKDFDVNRVTAEESIIYEDSQEPEKDKIGVPLTTTDVETIVINQNIDKKVEKQKKSLMLKEKKPMEEMEDFLLVDTDSSSEKMDVGDITADGMEAIFRKRLKELTEREHQLRTELVLIQNEILKLEAMIKAAEEVTKIEAKRKADEEPGH